MSALLSLRNAGQPFPDSSHGCLARLDQQFPIVAADGKSQEVKPFGTSSFGRSTDAELGSLPSNSRSLTVACRVFLGAVVAEPGNQPGFYPGRVGLAHRAVDRGQIPTVARAAERCPDSDGSKSPADGPTAGPSADPRVRVSARGRTRWVGDKSQWWG